LSEPFFLVSPMHSGTMLLHAGFMPNTMLGLTYVYRFLLWYTHQEVSTTSRLEASEGLLSCARPPELASSGPGSNSIVWLRVYAYVELCVVSVVVFSHTLSTG
jgi:hypothetical protein